MAAGMKIVPVANYGAGLRPPKIGPNPDALVVLKDDGGIDLRCENTVEARRAAIIKLGLQMLQGEQVELPVQHEFIGGLYIRRLFIPKGTLLVGKVHKKDCVNVVERGDISIATESGSKRVKAGFTLASPAGLQKVGYANEDTVFTNIFRTDCSDAESVEEDVAMCMDEFVASQPLTIEGA